MGHDVIGRLRTIKMMRQGPCIRILEIKKSSKPPKAVIKPCMNSVEQALVARTIKMPKYTVFENQEI
jgi:hypothetical protein